MKFGCQFGQRPKLGCCFDGLLGYQSSSLNDIFVNDMNVYIVGNYFTIFAQKEYFFRDLVRAMKNFK